jgi:hypothetical protein
MKTFAGEFAFNFTSVMFDGDEKTGFNYQYDSEGNLVYTNKIFVKLRDIMNPVPPVIFYILLNKNVRIIYIKIYVINCDFIIDI